MVQGLPKLTYAVPCHMNHHLQAKVQFKDIDQVKSALKQDLSTALIIMNHKQKILQMKYCKCQVEYYINKSMSMLGTMVVQWVTKTIKVKENDTEVWKEVRGFSTYFLLHFQRVY